MEGHRLTGCPRLVLFDLDGTLTDPHDGITGSVAYALERLGQPVATPDRLRRFIGPPLQDEFAAYGVPADQVDRAVELYRERFVTGGGMFENRIYDGVVDVLDALAAQRVRMAVATSKPAVFAEQILDHFALRRYFDVVGGATLDGSRRRKDDVLRWTLAALDTGADGAVMVGDRAEDVRGAATLGIPTVGAGWGYAEPGELEAAGALAVASEPAALRHLLLPNGTCQQHSEP